MFSYNHTDTTIDYQCYHLPKLWKLCVRVDKSSCMYLVQLELAHQQLHQSVKSLRPLLLPRAHMWTLCHQGLAQVHRRGQQDGPPKTQRRPSTPPHATPPRIGSGTRTWAAGQPLLSGGPRPLLPQEHMCMSRCRGLAQAHGRGHQDGPPTTMGTDRGGQAHHRTPRHRCFAQVHTSGQRDDPLLSRGLGPGRPQIPGVHRSKTGSLPCRQQHPKSPSR
jgi:hypothetical protein